jgi:glycosyltransferase involved in cell wall biosynthesis
LSDIEARTAVRLKSFIRTTIARALDGLDHVFFFGPADRAIAMQRYRLSAERSSVIPFGVDTEFWRPMPNVAQEDFVVAIGQDRNRDYDLLAAAPGNHPTRIVTRQEVRVPSGAAHVQLSAGDFFGSDAMTDQDLRRLYNAARAVIVPLKDVYQPSGYSVTLQAMACGRPVILTRIRGLWTPELLKDGENCLLVPPGDAHELGVAIGRIRGDAEFAARLGQAARATALAHYGLDKIGGGTLALAKLGLSMSKKT